MHFMPDEYVRLDHEAAWSGPVGEGVKEEDNDFSYRL
jgi:hypothetical protein